MEIKLSLADVESVIGAHVITSVGKMMGVEKKEELNFKIEASYDSIDSITVSKKEPEAEVSETAGEKSEA